MVDDYLAELRARLPRGPGRARALAEAEDHLREAAGEFGEQEAIERFGSPAEVASRFRESSAHSAARLSALGLAGALLMPVLTYPIVENALPPAPWPSAAAMPSHLAWKQDAVAALLLVALGAGASALLVRRRGLRALLGPLVVAQTGLTAAATLAVILGFQWADAVAGTPGWLATVPLLLLTLVLVSGTLLARALLLAPPRGV